jgi:hypothetical protein
MISWTDKYGSFYTRFIDWIGFGIQKITEPKPVLTGQLVNMTISGELKESEVTGLLSPIVVSGGIVNIVDGSISRTQITGVLTIKK